MLALIPVMLLVATVCGAFYYWLRQRGLAAEEQANPQDRRRISLLTEITGYIGATLVLAGGGVTVGQHWAAMTDWDRVAVFGGTGLFFLAIGLVVVWVNEVAIQRMIGVLWFVSAACVGTAAGVAVHEVYGAAGAVTALSIGLSVTVYSAALWLVRRRELQMVALFAGLTTTVTAGIIAISGSPVPWLAIALGLWAFGIGWVIVGWQYPQPLWTTVPLGTLIALIGPSFAVWSHGWVFALAIATAAVAMMVSIPARNTLLLTTGTLALFGYIAAAVVRYYHASLGLPAALATCGLLLIAFALVMAWMRRRPADEEPPRVAPWSAQARRAAPRLGTPRLGTPRPGTPRLGTPRLGGPQPASGGPAGSHAVRPRAAGAESAGAAANGQPVPGPAVTGPAHADAELSAAGIGAGERGPEEPGTDSPTTLELPKAS